MSTALPSGWFNWIKPFANVPDTHVLNHSSLDGFLFLRYLKMLCVICLVGCCITWPVLIPLHVHGGMGNQQLDALTFGNVAHPNWYYVHAFQAWVFFGKLNAISKYPNAY
jgi:calcium permeable stress-gated cation channel